jgi:G3E family GTPase
MALNVITGFLGSGKTTLLKRLLQGESLGDTALLINEFGDVGIDHPQDHLDAQERHRA